MALQVHISYQGHQGEGFSRPVAVLSAFFFFFFLATLLSLSPSLTLSPPQLPQTTSRASFASLRQTTEISVLCAKIRGRFSLPAALAGYPFLRGAPSPLLLIHSLGDPLPLYFNLKKNLK